MVANTRDSARTHPHTHTHTHARTHAHTHTQTCKRIARTHTHIHTQYEGNLLSDVSQQHKTDLDKIFDKMPSIEDLLADIAAEDMEEEEGTVPGEGGEYRAEEEGFVENLQPEDFEEVPNMTHDQHAYAHTYEHKISPHQHNQHARTHTHAQTHTQPHKYPLAHTGRRRD